MSFTLQGFPAAAFTSVLALTLQLNRASSCLIEQAKRADAKSQKPKSTDNASSEEITLDLRTATPRPRTSLLNNAILTVNLLTSITLTIFGVLDATGSNHEFGFALCFLTSASIFISTIINKLTKPTMTGRWLDLITSSLLLLVFCVLFFGHSSSTNSRTFVDLTIDFVIFLLFGFFVTTSAYSLVSQRKSKSRDDNSKQKDDIESSTHADSSTDNEKEEVNLFSLIWMLRPYFWPAATAESAFKNRCRAISTWVFVIMSKTCNVIAPLAIGSASNALITNDWDTAVNMSILYVSLIFFGKFFKECQSLVYLRVAQAAFVELSEKTFGHLHRLSLDWHLKKKLGDVMRSMDRGIAASDTLMKYLFLWLIPAIFECVIVCLIFFFKFDDVNLALSLFFFVYAYCLMTIILTLWRKKFRKAVNTHDNQWHDIATDSLINFETVKYFTAENHEEKRFSNAIKSYQKQSVAVQASLSFLNTAQQVLMQFALGLSLALSVRAIKQKSDCCVNTPEIACDALDASCCTEYGQACEGMDMGDFVAVLSYVVNLFSPLNFLGSVYNAIVMAVVDLTNLNTLLKEEVDVHDKDGAIELVSPGKDSDSDSDTDLAVEFRDVHFSYKTQSKERGLTGLNLKVPKGNSVALVGSTGAGKTTILRLIFRFWDVVGGAVLVNGVDVRDCTQESLRKIVGVVPQDTPLFNDTIRYNIVYGNRDATQADLERVAREAHILEFIEGLELGWDTVVGERGLKLSGGEKQRVAIARCLLKNPPIVVLDEATSALDSITESSVQKALERLSDKRTIIVIAHRLGTIRNCDQICVLRGGMLVEKGKHDELMDEDDGIYKSMWDMQLKAVEGKQTLK